MNTKVLVVDDSKFIVMLLTDILKEKGYSVYSCNDSSSVLEIASEIRPDVILLDIVMPGLDGFEICKLLNRERELKDTPVIMITAKTDSIDIKKALELGAFDYIKKPIDDIEVVARVQSALRFKRQQDKLREMAMKDGLTGLYNHTSLIKLFQEEYRKQHESGRGISFAMLDIDFFKKVNDSFGHVCGDMVLKDLSLILTKSIRECDIVGRYGGEEFSIVFKDDNIDTVLGLCEKVRKNVEEHEFNLGNENIKITVSIGAYIKSPAESIRSSEMIIRADEALYKAKKSGRNRTEVHYHI